jgi:hypothetical protein
MDWLLLLSPLVVLAILLPLLLIGCGLDETGGATGRLLLLDYSGIPPRSDPVKTVKGEFTAQNGGIKFASDSEDVTFEQGNITGAPLEGQILIPKGDSKAIQCTCAVTLVLQSGGTIGPILGQTLKPTTHATVTFKLSYWPTEAPDKPYNPSSFSISFMPPG